MIQFSDNDHLAWYDSLASELLDSTPFHTGTVHAMDTSDDPRYATREVLNARIELMVPSSRDLWTDMTHPNMPWAEDHFQERIGGVPVNPPDSSKNWPFAQAGHEKHIDANGRFSHTYPERFWPKHAGHDPDSCGITGNESYKERMRWAEDCGYMPRTGIRFRIGDLHDVIWSLTNNPLTRQAFLPIWFPEDTYAATQGIRVPCSIGYQFMVRGEYMHCWYTMRSCDYIRYLRDDIYMAGRLMQHMCERVEAHGAGLFYPGNMYLTISSLHTFVGDDWALKRLQRRNRRATNA